MNNEYILLKEIRKSIKKYELYEPKNKKLILKILNKIIKKIELKNKIKKYKKINFCNQNIVINKECPYKMKSVETGFLVNAGSDLCIGCRYFKDISLKKSFVKCSFEYDHIVIDYPEILYILKEKKWIEKHLEKIESTLRYKIFFGRKVRKVYGRCYIEKVNSYE